MHGISSAECCGRYFRQIARLTKLGQFLVSLKYRPTRAVRDFVGYGYLKKDLSFHVS